MDIPQTLDIFLLIANMMNVWLLYDFRKGNQLKYRSGNYQLSDPVPVIYRAINDHIAQRDV